MTNKEKLLKVLLEIPSEDLGRYLKNIYVLKKICEAKCPAYKYCQEEIMCSDGIKRTRLLVSGGCDILLAEWMDM